MSELTRQKLDNCKEIEKENGEYDQDHPRRLIPELIRLFYTRGWFPGSGGAMSIRRGDEIYITPSGVQKERVESPDLFVTRLDGTLVSQPPVTRGLKMSSCSHAIMNIYQCGDVGAVIHTHSKAAVMITLLYPGTEFRMTHQQEIRCVKHFITGQGYKFREEIVVPIVENGEEEKDIAGIIQVAMKDYPDTSAVLIRRHGIYIWGKNWQQMKMMAEAYDYLFDLALKMKLHGLDPAKKPTVPSGAYIPKEYKIDQSTGKISDFRPCLIL